MDWTPFIHALIAVAVQLAVGKTTGNWWLGGLLGCAWWIAREHTQAEYRWIEKYGNGLRTNMPQWAGFDPRVWNKASLFDWLVPVVLCCIAYCLATRFGGFFNV